MNKQELYVGAWTPSEESALIYTVLEVDALYDNTPALRPTQGRLSEIAWRKVANRLSVATGRLRSVGACRTRAGRLGVLNKGSSPKEEPEEWRELDGLFPWEQVEPDERLAYRFRLVGKMQDGRPVLMVWTKSV